MHIVIILTFFLNLFTMASAAAMPTESPMSSDISFADTPSTNLATADMSSAVTPDPCGTYNPFRSDNQVGEGCRMPNDAAPFSIKKCHQTVGVTARVTTYKRCTCLFFRYVE